MTSSEHVVLMWPSAPSTYVPTVAACLQEPSQQLASENPCCVRCPRSACYVSGYICATQTRSIIGKPLLVLFGVVNMSRCGPDHRLALVRVGGHLFDCSVAVVDFGASAKTKLVSVFQASQVPTLSKYHR